MWFQLILTLTFLNVAQLSASICTTPNLSLGSQCLVVAAPDTCVTPFVTVGDQCLFFATFAEMTWQEGRQMCHAMDAELATIITATQLQTIIHYINENELGGRHFWTGGNDLATEGLWQYTSGQPVPIGTPFWWATLTGQNPDNARGNEHCLHLYGFRFHYFNDFPCSQAAFVLCERPIEVHDTAPLPPPVDCPALFVPVGGLCLSFMTWADQTWAEARQSCQGLHGDLAIINQSQQLREIYLYLHEEDIDDHSFWLSGSDETTEGMWVWTDGTAVPTDSPYWGSLPSGIEPDGGTTENCLLLEAAGSHYFRDKSCTFKASPLCQYST